MATLGILELVAIASQLCNDLAEWSERIKGLPNDSQRLQQLAKSIQAELEKYLESGTTQIEHIDWVNPLNEAWTKGVATAKEIAEKPKWKVVLKTTKYSTAIQSAGQAIEDAMQPLAISHMHVSTQILKIVQAFKSQLEDLKKDEGEREQLRSALLDAFKSNDPDSLDAIAQKEGINGGGEELRRQLGEEYDETLQDLKSWKVAHEKGELEAVLELSRLALGAAEDCPDDYRCPITLEVMDDPVILVQTGNTFDRKALHQALANNPHKDPLSNEEFQGEAQMAPNKTLKRAIVQWRDERSNQSVMEPTSSPSENSPSQPLGMEGYKDLEASAKATRDPRGHGPANDANKEDGESAEKESASPNNQTGKQRRLLTILGLCILVIAGAVVGAIVASKDGNSEGDGATEPTTAPITTVDELVEYIGPLVATDTNVFLDESSPEFQALNWLATVDQLPLFESLHATKERYIVVKFFMSTGGESWETYISPSSSTCEWTGMLCNEQQELLELNMKNANLQGTLPTELGLLTGLSYLGLSDNSLTGTLPTQLGNLSALDFLVLHENSLTGSVPTELGNLSTLWRLFLCCNQFTGSFPTEVLNLSSLSILAVCLDEFAGLGSSENMQECVCCS